MKVQIQGDVPKHLMAQMQKDKPSDDSEFWANSGCNKCYGRGVVGRLTSVVGTNTISNEMLCVCVHRRWKKWQEEWLEEHQPKKVKSGNGKQMEKKKTELVKPRLEKIDDMILSFKSEILSFTDKLSSLSHHKDISKIDSHILQEKDRLDELDDVIEQLLAKSEECDVRADDLTEEAKNFRRAAGRINQQVEEERQVRATQQSTVRRLEQNREEVEKALKRASHPLKRKRRVAEAKLEKLEARKQRIIRESGLDSSNDQDSTQLSDIKEKTIDTEFDNSGSVG